MLADLDADGPRTAAVHAYMGENGLLFLFPLGQPAPWRLLGMAPASAGESADKPPRLDELQALADGYTGAALQLHDPVWSTYFRIYHRHASHYRRGPRFVAGDAAHIHSPAGAQGMNTGIQDAWNLGWKLALVIAGDAHEDLLGTYETERMPVGRYVLRFTDRAFRIATSTNPVIRLLRTHLAPQLVRLGLSSRRGRALAFRSLSQLAISYRQSPACQEGQARLRGGARAGDRLPDVPVVPYGRPPTTLQQVLAPASLHLLLTGPPDSWPTDDARLDQLRRFAHHGAPAGPRTAARCAPRHSGQGARALGCRRSRSHRASPRPPGRPPRLPRRRHRPCRPRPVPHPLGSFAPSTIGGRLPGWVAGGVTRPFAGPTRDQRDWHADVEALTRADARQRPALIRVGRWSIPLAPHSPPGLSGPDLRLAHRPGPTV